MKGKRKGQGKEGAHTVRLYSEALQPLGPSPGLLSGKATTPPAISAYKERRRREEKRESSCRAALSKATAP